MVIPARKTGQNFGLSASRVLLVSLTFGCAFQVLRNLEQLGTSQSFATQFKGSTDQCLDQATSVICSAQYESDRPSCRRNPREFLVDLSMDATFTEEELEARDLLIKNRIDAVSIGASKTGLCNDVIRDKGTLCTDRPQLDLFDVSSWLKLFGRQREGVRTLHAEHVLEHFHPIQVQQIAAASFLMLKPGGVFRVAVPDGYKPSPSYQQYIRPGGTASGHGQKHMVAWTVDSLTPIFEAVGFKIVLQEYFDSKGTFHSSEDAYEDSTLGRIRRSWREDKRNNLPDGEVITSKIGDLLPDTKPGEPRYTSLWFDAIKPAACEGTMVGMQL